MTSGKDKPVFVISIAAKLCDVHPQTLRMYERKGLVQPKRLKDRRLYSEADIERLRMIQALTQDEGVNLAGVKRIISMQSHLEKAIAEVKKLEQEMTELRIEMRDRVREIHRKQSTQIEKIRGGALIRFESKRKRY